MADQYATIRDLIRPALSIVAVVVVGLGLLRFVSPPLRGQPSRLVALAIAATIGVLVGGFFGLLFTGWASAGSGGLAVALAAGIGLLVAGSSAAGYALLTIGRPARTWALVGCFLGPLLLAGGYMVMTRAEATLDQLTWDARQAELHESSAAAITIEVRDVEATYSPSGDGPDALDTLSLTVALRAADDLVIRTDTYIAYPTFRLIHPAGWSAGVEAPPGAPSHLPAGVDVPYELRFETFTHLGGTPHEGPWVLTVGFEDTRGQPYELVTELDVPPKE